MSLGNGPQCLSLLSSFSELSSCAFGFAVPQAPRVPRLCQGCARMLLADP